jgi:hypothetical protein
MEYRTLLYLITWGIWLVRNAKIFEDVQVPTFKVSLQSLSLFSSYKPSIKPKSSCVIGEVIMNKDYAWICFMHLWDEATLENSFQE